MSSTPPFLFDETQEASADEQPLESSTLSITEQNIVSIYPDPTDLPLPPPPAHFTQPSGGRPPPSSSTSSTSTPQLSPGQRSGLDTAANLISMGISSLSELSNLIPAPLKEISLKDLALKRGPQVVQPDPTKDRILWTHFEHVKVHGEARLYLTLGYENGFQVWDVTDSHNRLQVVSKRSPNEKPDPVTLIRFLPDPENAVDDGPFKGKRPLIAVVGGEKRDGSEGYLHGSSAKIYSLRTHEFVHSLRFRSPIFALEASSKLITVALKEQIFSFKPSTLETEFTLTCFPNATQGVLALGPRWLAYASAQGVPTGPGGAANPSGFPAGSTTTIVEQAKGVAKDLAAGVMYLGDLAQKTITTYFAPDAPVEQLPPGTPIDSSVAGTVIVRDIMTRSVVAHFRAHSQPISAISFDPSGTLLVTASIDGTTVNVFQVMPGSGNQGTRHLYKLFRGVTSAAIQSIQINSHWVAASSTHGTTHIFPINLTGGPISLHTHVPALTSTTHESYGGSVQPAPAVHHGGSSAPTEAISLSVAGRIWQSVVLNTSSTQFKVPVATTFVPIPPRSAGQEHLYVISNTGQLVLYSLTPCESETEQDRVQLKIEEMSRWDVCRRASWDEQEIPITSRMPQTNPDRTPTDQTAQALLDDARWLSNVEISTYGHDVLPLWLHPQFHFKTLQGPHSAETPPPPPSSASASAPHEPPRMHLWLTPEELLSRSIEIRRIDPVPLKQQRENESTFEMLESVVVFPSAPSRDIISKAMSTPIGSFERNADFVHARVPSTPPVTSQPIVPSQPSYQPAFNYFAPPAVEHAMLHFPTVVDPPPVASGTIHPPPASLSAAHAAPANPFFEYPGGADSRMMQNPGDSVFGLGAGGSNYPSRSDLNSSLADSSAPPLPPSESRRFASGDMGGPQHFAPAPQQPEVTVRSLSESLRQYTNQDDYFSGRTPQEQQPQPPQQDFYSTHQQQGMSMSQNYGAQQNYEEDGSEDEVEEEEEDLSEVDVELSGAFAHLGQRPPAQSLHQHQPNEDDIFS